MAEVKEEILTFLSKVWAWLIYILIGLMAKYSYDFMTGKKITFLQAMASAGIALFVGFIASVICLHNGYEQQGMWVVPCATLVSDKIVMALFAFDYKGTIGDWLKYWSDKWK